MTNSKVQAIKKLVKEILQEYHKEAHIIHISKETSDEFRLVCGYLVEYKEELLLFGIVPSGSGWRYKDKLLAVRQAADKPNLEVLW